MTHYSNSLEGTHLRGRAEPPRPAGILKFVELCPTLRKGLCWAWRVAGVSATTNRAEGSPGEARGEQSARLARRRGVAGRSASGSWQHYTLHAPSAKHAPPSRKLNKRVPPCPARRQEEVGWLVGLVLSPRLVVIAAVAVLAPVVAELLGVGVVQGLPAGPPRGRRLPRSCPASARPTTTVAVPAPPLSSTCPAELVAKIKFLTGADSCGEGLPPGLVWRVGSGCGGAGLGSTQGESEQVV